MVTRAEGCFFQSVRNGRAVLPLLRRHRLLLSATESWPVGHLFSGCRIPSRIRSGECSATVRKQVAEACNEHLQVFLETQISADASRSPPFLLKAAVPLGERPDHLT